MDVGFIGLGNMGSRIVHQQLEADLTMTLWARRPESLEPFVGTGARTVASPAEVGAASDVVGICVWDEHDVEDVLLRDDGVLAGLRPGGVVVVHSTISREGCRRLGAETAARGCGLIDAPVSVGANVPKLLVLVGGEAETFERCRPALDAFGDPVVHLGPLGSGQVAKLVNNTVLAASIGLGQSALDLGVDLGLDPEALRSALSAGSARGMWTGFVGAQPLVSAGRPAGRTGEWARKDVGLMLEQTESAGLDVDRLVLDVAQNGVEVVDGT